MTSDSKRLNSLVGPLQERLHPSGGTGFAKVGGILSWLGVRFAGGPDVCMKMAKWAVFVAVGVSGGGGVDAATPAGDPTWAPISLAAAETETDKAVPPDPVPAEPVALPTPRLVVSADGKEVIDAKAKLAWRRCVEGMIWFGGRCTGRAKTFTMIEAQALATAEGKATGQRWRLPHIPELKILLDKSHTGRGAMVDAALFPATPANWHWSASVSVGAGGAVNQYNYGNIMSGVTPGNANQLRALEGWGFNFATDEASGGINKRDALYVRLVRPHF